MQVALTIAGSDPAGGAGVQGDLRAFYARRVHGVSVLTAVIAQATRGVRRVWPLTPEQVRAQLDALLEDVPVHASKTGALASGAVAAEVAAALERTKFPLVIDPVLSSSSGARLLDDEGLRVLRARLLPRATLITPNAPELGVLLDEPAPTDAEGLARAAERLRQRGARAVLAKGGHLAGDPTDVLVSDDGVVAFAAPRLASRCTRGTGCTLSAAITADLARGSTLRAAVEAARALLRHAMAHGIPIGEGESPVGLLAAESPLRSQAMSTPQVGDEAPNFTADTDDGRLTLRDLRGKKVVLYFYPKDNTPGCTREACDFRDAHARLARKGVVVLGVSPDGVKSHAGFKAKHELPFALVADPDKAIALAYGVYGEKTMYGKKVMGIVRSTFLVDEQGKVAAVWSKVKVEGHVDAVLAAL